jgi:uncharacterized protein with HEPN domain
VTRTDAEHLDNAREHLRILHAHMERSDLADDTVFDAVCMRLSAAIESISAINQPARDRAFGSTWPAIASVRNRIAHGYTYVDREIIDNTVAHDLDDLERGLDRLAEELDRAGDQGAPQADDK